MKNTILFSAISLALIVPAAANAATISPWVAQEHLRINQTVGAAQSRATLTNTTEGVAVSTTVPGPQDLPARIIGRLWSSKASQGWSGRGGEVEYSVPYLPILQMMGLTGGDVGAGLSLGWMQLLQPGQSAQAAAVGFHLRAGVPALSLFFQHAPLRASGQGQTISAPLVAGLEGLAGAGGGLLHWQVAYLAPQYLGLGTGVSIHPGAMVSIGLTRGAWQLKLTQIFGLQEGGTWVRPGASGVSAGLSAPGVRDSVLAWPILPGDPAASYQRGLILSGSYQISPRVTLDGGVHLAPPVHVAGKTLATTQRFSESIQASSAAVALKVKF